MYAKRRKKALNSDPLTIHSFGTILEFVKSYFKAYLKFPEHVATRNKATPHLGGMLVHHKVFHHHYNKLLQDIV